MKNSKSKYILCPDYKPLFAMRKCFGPPHGPLESPCLTPIDVIHGLLLQSGSDALTIYEVTKNEKGRTTTPVELTLENYQLPYEEILNGKKTPTVTLESEPVVAPVEPVIIGSVPAKEVHVPIPEELKNDLEEHGDIPVLSDIPDSVDGEPSETSVVGDIISQATDVLKDETDRETAEYVSSGDTESAVDTTGDEPKQEFDTAGYIAPAEEGEDLEKIEEASEPVVAPANMDNHKNNKHNKNGKKHK